MPFSLTQLTMISKNQNRKMEEGTICVVKRREIGKTERELKEGFVAY